jgi:hypothetical protein
MAMSSGSPSVTKTRKVELAKEAIEAGLDPVLLRAIEEFQPLPFSAGEEAARWLRAYVAAPTGTPWRVVLELDGSGAELLGFLVLGYTQFTLSPGDVPVVEVAKKLDAPEEPQAAVEVAWIARSEKTQKGFGKELFTYAVSLAIDGGAIAMIVTPHDPKTARKVWTRRFSFRPPRESDQSPEAPQRLWYPVHKPKGGSWPS